MRKKLAVIVILLLIAAVLYLRYSGVTHEDICEVVTAESDVIQGTVDDRYRKLDQKLDRIEGKIDRILELANRPLPDGMRRSE